MRHYLLVLYATGTLLVASSAKADVFGGDDLILGEILTNAAQQLVQLEQLVSAGQDSLGLMQQVNQGLSEVLSVAGTLGATDPGLFREIQSIQAAQSMMNQVYGTAVASRDQTLQGHADQAAAEAIVMGNGLYQYAGSIDKVGESVKTQSQGASPKGAERLTAQSMGVMIEVMNQSLRTQATGLKLQAEQVALQNHKDKDYTAQVQTATSALDTAMSTTQPAFALPRF